jgi:hypothetical protein
LQFEKATNWGWLGAWAVLGVLGVLDVLDDQHAAMASPQPSAKHIAAESTTL